MADPMPTIPQYQSVTPLTINYPAPPDPYDYFRIQNEMQKQQMAWYPHLVALEAASMPTLTNAQIAAQQSWENAMFPITQQQQAAMFAQQLPQQQQLFAQQLPQQVAQQTALMQGAFAEQMRQMPVSAAKQFGLEQKYAPGYQQLFSSMTGAANPQFMPTYNALGESVRGGLNAGYDLGPGLSTEIEQAIRGAQTARGNWLGPAPTAEEAFGKGQASIDLYNQRIGQAQNFLQGRQPTDLWGALQMARPTPLVNQPYYPTPSNLTGLGAASPSSALLGGMSPSQGFVQNPGLATASPQIYGTYSGALGQWGATSVAGQSDYNTSLINAANVNTQGMFTQYGASWDQYMFDQAVQNGMFTTPSTGTSGFSQAAPLLGAGISAAGGIAAAGVAAGGITAGTAGAAGLAAAVSAAGAALCWLARKVVPDSWKEWRRFLFTDASDSLRTAYIFGAKRMSLALSEERGKEIAAIMQLVFSRTTNQ